MIHRIAQLANVPPGTHFKGEITSDLSKFEGVWIHQVNRRIDHDLGTITKPFIRELDSGQNHILLDLVVSNPVEITIDWSLEKPLGTPSFGPKTTTKDLQPGTHIFIWYFGV